ncbi:hypothetical protein [Frigoribacterium sp. UYMn621]|uniref:hypothetical protein n=1 Tax=Frigoribacterium sp. UYMn621 TaxID=3156343 RepID=UPI003397CDEE
MTAPGPPQRSGLRLSGVSLIIVATGVAGVTSYLVTWLVPNQIGLARYALFAVFWSFLYLLVGTLSGVQQEVTRATHAVAVDVGGGSRHHAPARAAVFAVLVSAIVLIVILGSAPAWVSAIFPIEGWALVGPLAVGAGSYVFVAVLAGSFYGVAQWVPIALMIVVDSLLRLAGIGIVLALTHDIVALAWAAAIPFPGALVVLWLFIRQSIVGRSELDVGYGRLTWNVARTTLAAAAASAMVSGLPFLIGITAPGEPRALVGTLILSITLARAPLIVVAMSLQSYFIVTFRSRPRDFWRTFLRLQAMVLGGGFVLAIIGWLIGPAVFSLLFRGQVALQGWYIAVLVISSALVAALFISAPAVLARGQHFGYTAGWVAAAVITVLSLELPVDLTTRTVVALLIGPVAGLVIHGFSLAFAKRPSPVDFG